MNAAIFSTLEFDKILEQLSHLTISSLGQELVLQLKPLADLNEIKQKLAAVTELKSILDFDDPFPLPGLEDITPALKKAQVQGSFLLPEEFARVLRTLEVARKIHFYFSNRQEKYPHLAQIARQIVSFKAIEKEVSRCIDSATYEIFDHASSNLHRIRRSIAATEQQIRKKMEQMSAELSRKGYLQDHVIAMRDGRLVLMVKDEFRNKVPGVIHDQSATGSTLFMEPLATLEWNNQIRALRMEERREIEAILRGLTDLIRHQLPELESTMRGLGQLDFIYAKARLSQAMQGNEPAINSERRLEIIQGKHPLLMLRHNGRPVIPFTLQIGDKFRTLVISGPNAGGKTVALKTVGLLCLMTACGLHIPADASSDVAIFRQIFAAIGDQQSIENDLSTFSSHVAQLREILEQAALDDLVLIDEIGAGTDPDEGAALAIAILERLTAIGCITVVSTHLGALKVFAHETPGVENGSMEFDRETLQPTYHFQLGIPGSSYASEIARRWGIPETIIGRTQELVGSKKNRFEALLEDLENRSQNYRKLTNELSIKQSQLDGLMKLYRQKYEELKSEERKWKQQAIDESQQLLRQAKKTVEQVIRDIREQQASREAIKAAQEQLRQQQVALDEAEARLASQRRVVPDEETSETLDQVEIGQEVYWPTYRVHGTVLSAPDAEKRVLVQTDDMKVKVPLEELTTSTTPKKTVATTIQLNYEKRHSNEIDVRGLRVEEAVKVVDKFLDEAILSGWEQIYIIHGKGTGALKKAIHEYLEQHRRVKSKGFARWNMGDTGMTVVELQ
ncbi:MAG: endonuclease MutS2 [candidate division KSB1 bacterium]|nr:endonuclease MutS2 [candidate division KSB1 bacterium]